jgi:hypothetical protein
MRHTPHRYTLRKSQPSPEYPPRVLVTHVLEAPRVTRLCPDTVFNQTKPPTNTIPFRINKLFVLCLRQGLIKSLIRYALGHKNTRRIIARIKIPTVVIPAVVITAVATPTVAIPAVATPAVITPAVTIPAVVIPAITNTRASYTRIR